jgi:putative transposase
MTTARAHSVDMSLARWYHCVSCCVRKAFLLGEGDGNRKEWSANRLDELAEVFAVAVGGFSAMDDHRQDQIRLDPDIVQA